MPIENAQELLLDRMYTAVVTPLRTGCSMLSRATMAVRCRSRRAVIGGILMVAFAPLWQIQMSFAESAVWQTIGTGLEITRVRLDSNAFLSPELLMVKIDLKRYRIATVRGIDFGSHENDVRSLSRASKALVGINANFFDEKGKALGLVMSHGIAHQPIHSGGKTLTGIFQITRKGAEIVSRNAFKYDNVSEAIQAGPRLVDGGAAVGGQRSSHVTSRRSGICVQSPESVILYISSGFIGISIADVQKMLLRPGVACKQALNLDGGGSAQLFVSNQLPDAISGLQEMVIHGSDDVPVILGVFPRRPA